MCVIIHISITYLFLKNAVCNYTLNITSVVTSFLENDVKVCIRPQVVGRTKDNLKDSEEVVGGISILTVFTPRRLRNCWSLYA